MIFRRSRLASQVEPVTLSHDEKPLWYCSVASDVRVLCKQWRVSYVSWAQILEP